MFAERITDAFSFFSGHPELLTLLLAAIPFTELRAALPFAYGALGLPILSAFFWSFLGSLIPAFVILPFAEGAIEWCNRRSPFCSRIIGRTIERTRRKFRGKYERYGEIGLVIFVGAPLPLTGVWTGSLAAVVFGIRFRRALGLIAAGNLIAAALVALASTGLLNAARFLA
jgi:uncharacterized membrane protein